MLWGAIPATAPKSSSRGLRCRAHGGSPVSQGPIAEVRLRCLRASCPLRSVSPSYRATRSEGPRNCVRPIFKCPVLAILKCPLLGRYGAAYRIPRRKAIDRATTCWLPVDDGPVTAPARRVGSRRRDPAQAKALARRSGGSAPRTPRGFPQACAGPVSGGRRQRLGRPLPGPSQGDDQSPAQPIPSTVAPRQSPAPASAALSAYCRYGPLILPPYQLAIRCRLGLPGTLRTGHLRIALTKLLTARLNLDRFTLHDQQSA